MPCAREKGLRLNLSCCWVCLGKFVLNTGNTVRYMWNDAFEHLFMEYILLQLFVTCVTNNGWRKIFNKIDCLFKCSVRRQGSIEKWLIAWCFTENQFKCTWRMRFDEEKGEKRKPLPEKEGTKASVYKLLTGDVFR